MRPPHETFRRDSGIIDNVQLASAVFNLQKEVSALKDSINVHENWHSEIKGWYGKEVRIETILDLNYDGILKWTDRYCICIVEKTKNSPRIFTKGGIVSIRQL